eukprot:2778494-Prorocentrum_lima.AAC.1
MLHPTLKTKAGMGGAYVAWDDKGKMAEGRGAVPTSLALTCHAGEWEDYGLWQAVLHLPPIL